MDNEKQIIQSWEANAGNWIRLIESNGIESRRLATNKAMVDAICCLHPRLVLDIGCGEGWLAKELADTGITVTGIDITSTLVEKARGKAPGNFYVASFEDLAAAKIRFPELFDAIAINFALAGKESTENLLASLPAYLIPEGKLVIQTLHPYVRKEINDYKSGWKPGSWDGLGDQFTLPYEWYFRTWEDWLQLLGYSGFKKVNTSEILHPVTRKPLSVLFECSII